MCNCQHLTDGTARRADFGKSTSQTNPTASHNEMNEQGGSGVSKGCMGELKLPRFEYYGCVLLDKIHAMFSSYSLQEQMLWQQ